MASSNVGLALELLESIEFSKVDLPFSLENDLQTFKVELKFLRTFVLRTINWRDDHERLCLTSLLACMKKFTECAPLLPPHPHQSPSQDMLLRMKMNLKIFRPAIREAYVIWSGDTWLSNSTVSAESMVKIFDSLLENVKDLVNWKVELDANLKGQIKALEDKLQFLRNFIASPAKQCIQDQKLPYIMRYVEAIANDTACLSYICWVDQIDEEARREINLKLANLLNRANPINPYMRGIYSGVMKALKSLESDSLIMHEVLKRFTNLLLNDMKQLQNLEASLIVPVGDHIEMLIVVQLLWTNLFKNPPEDGEDENLNDLWTLIKNIASDAGSFICSLYDGEKKDGMTRDTKVSLLKFLEKIKIINFKHRIRFPKLDIEFPRTDQLGFIDFLLEKLSELLIYKPHSVTFVIHEIGTIKEDLNFLRSSLKEMAKPYNDFEELKNLTSRVTDAAYEAEYLIDSLCVGDSPILYNMLNLLDVMQEINLIKIEVANDKASDASLQNLTGTSDHNAEVGFKAETERIIDALTRGSAQLEIVSIVGMPGIGKTTLAKKLYNHPSVSYCFHKRSWCYVSQVYRKRELLLDILGDVIEITDKIFAMDDGELAEQLYKSLRGRKYLIVMDDMWNIGAWDDLSESFPNDANGSRILFTSRIHDVAFQTKYKSSLHPLGLLSDEESWKLLQQMLFCKDPCPPLLVPVGKKISKYCKGLPLALVVIAGLLARTDKKQDRWEQVAKSLNSYIASDPLKEFMNISELSYRNLPDHLKPCFLYFGAFVEDKEIPVRNLTWIWIAEGFVRNSREFKSLEDVAEDYLRDLIDRSLINVAKKRSDGGIKVCYLHDLLHDFCVEKAKEENFFQIVRRNDEYKLCRLSIDSATFRFTDSTPSGPRVRSILLFANKRYSFEHIGIAYMFQKFKLLKVLDLGCINLGDSVPSEVTSLVHLRYLSIWGCMNSIPSSIACLSNLQTFIVKGLKGEILLPESIWDLVILRHLHVNERTAFILNGNELEDSSALQNLETFSTPSLSCGKDAEKMLRRLPNLRKLRCILFESGNSSEKCNHLPVFDFLSQLETLKVFYHGSLLEFCQLNFPSTLKKLTLSNFHLPWSKISTIARLPNLEVLKLQFRAFEGREWTVNDDEFLKLKFLKLDYLDIAIWNGYGYPFPCLERLVLRSCKQLQEIPSILGESSTLQSIEVHWCRQSAAESAKQIQGQQWEMGNELEVIIQ